MSSIYDNFVWFNGVVEDRDDPKKIGRCKVRCLGYHTPNKSILPTDDLPLAFPIAPITSASVSGIGTSPVGPVEGTWVFGFFMDGKSAQEPVMIGTLPGIPENKSEPSIGFNDPNGKYPKEDMLGEADTSRIARNENIDLTIIQSKIDDISEMETSGGVDSPETISEPQTPYNASYPYNKVMETESGHVFEVDDTEGSERIHVYHKSGTFIEIHPDGSMVRKVKGQNHEVMLSDNNVHVKGDLNITVENDANIYTKGDVKMKTDGNFTHDVTDGDYELNVGGQILINGGNGGSSIKMTSTSIKQESGSIMLN